MLERVTMTGADDSVEPGQLWEVSEQFPFVEWGLLLGSHAGQSRFPSVEWWQALAKEAVKRQHVAEVPNFSLHLCGRRLRMMLEEPTTDRYYGGLPPAATALCQRMQFNTHGEPVERLNTQALVDFLTGYLPTMQVLQQIDGGVGHKLYDFLYNNGVNAFPFFDLSHGGGVSPEAWPVTPYPDPQAGGACRRYCGFGGGLGPDNLAAQIPLIANAACDGPYWIDMETKVRSTTEGRDCFNLDKVIECLRICQPETVWSQR